MRVRIETERLILRPFVPEDYEAALIPRLINLLLYRFPRRF
jgi:hypothetical protein